MKLTNYKIIYKVNLMKFLILSLTVRILNWALPYIYFANNTVHHNDIMLY